MNEPSVAFTLLALLLASAISLIVGFAAGCLIVRRVFKQRRTKVETQRNSLSDSICDNLFEKANEGDIDPHNTANPLAAGEDANTEKQIITKLLKHKLVQDKLIKSTLKYNLQVKKAWRTSNSNLDLLDRKLKLQQVANDQLKAKNTRVMQELAKLNARSGITTTSGVSPVTNKQNTNLQADSVKRTATAAGTQRTTATVVDSTHDDLTRIKGIGTKTKISLREIGINTFAQLAALDNDQIREIDRKLSFQGRSHNYRWVDQARTIVNKEQREENRVVVTA